MLLHQVRAACCLRLIINAGTILYLESNAGGVSGLWVKRRIMPSACCGQHLCLGLAQRLQLTCLSVLRAFANLEGSMQWQDTAPPPLLAPRSLPPLSAACRHAPSCLSRRPSRPIESGGPLPLLQHVLLGWPRVQVRQRRLPLQGGRRALRLHLDLPPPARQLGPLLLPEQQVRRAWAMLQRAGLRNDAHRVGFHRVPNPSKRASSCCSSHCLLACCLVPLPQHATSNPLTPNAAPPPRHPPQGLCQRPVCEDLRSWHPLRQAEAPGRVPLPARQLPRQLPLRQRRLHRQHPLLRERRDL